jgi:predicted unusual protein kinase regulating ubiquinone biosynthesis (AarF/ABC1/UbiB family)
VAKRKDKDAIPTGRVRRTAKVGGLAAGQTARNYATKAANLTRDSEGRRAAAEKRQLDAAEQIVETLGQMKGAAMKVGQVMSFMDTGALPPEVQERFQTKLGALRDSAPKVSFDDMRKVIEHDLEEPIDEVFAEFDPEPVAAASIGQVYRARLHDGRDVAVKVQYPSVAAAVRADMQNLGLILRAARSMAPGMDAKAMAAEIRERIYEELDYEHEAQAQRQMARLWRGHPFVVIPDVVTRLSRERVLVTDWVEGRRFDAVKELPQEERDHFAETVYRFFVGGFYRTGFISGDPHPGNFLLQEDGRVAFLDFGMTRHVSLEHVEEKIEMFRAGLALDAKRYHAAAAKIGFFPADDARIEPEVALAHFVAVSDWWREDRPFTIDQSYIRRVMIDLGDPRSEYWSIMRHSTIPPEAMIAGRTDTLTLGVLGQLEATANWHRIVREYLYGDPPSTPLGREDADYWRTRPARRAA